MLKRYLSEDSGFMLQIFYLYMALALFGRKYVTFPLILLAGWLCYQLFRLIRQRRQSAPGQVWQHIRFISILALVAAYLLVNMLSTVQNQGDSSAWDGWEKSVTWLFCLLLGGCFALYYPQRKIYAGFVYWQSAILLIFSLLSLGTHWELFAFPILGVMDYKTKKDAFFMMFVLAVYVNSFHPQADRRQRAVNWLALLLGLIAIASMGTSRLWIPVLGGGILLAAWCGRSRGLAWMPAVIAAAVLAGLLLRPDLLQRLTTITMADPLFWRLKVLNYRDIVWQLSLLAFSAKPWLGIGPGNFMQTVEQIRQSIGLVDPSGQRYLHAHNIFWNPFVVCGVVGGLIHGLLMVQIVGFIAERFSQPRTQRLALNLLMVWFVYWAYGLVEMAPAMEEVIPFVWGATGLLAFDKTDTA